MGYEEHGMGTAVGAAAVCSAQRFLHIQVQSTVSSHSRWSWFVGFQLSPH